MSTVSSTCSGCAELRAWASGVLLSLGLVKKSLRGTLGALARNKKLRADSTDSKAALNSLSLPPPSSLHLSFTIYFNSFFRRCSNALSFPRRFFSPPPPFPRTFLISYSRALYMCVYTHNYIYIRLAAFFLRAHILGSASFFPLILSRNPPPPAHTAFARFFVPFSRPLSGCAHAALPICCCFFFFFFGQATSYWQRLTIDANFRSGHRRCIAAEVRLRAARYVGFGFRR